MQQFTKKAITEVFIQLLNQKPLDKITVTDIVNECGINRNTFYYYYKDIYALVEEIFKIETQKAIELQPEDGTWQDIFMSSVDFAMQNKPAIYHIYNSLSRDQLDRYLFDITYPIMLQFVRQQAAGLNAKKEDVVFVARVYENAIVGLVIDWVRGGMNDNPKEVINRISVMFDGSIRFALSNSVSRTNTGTHTAVS